MIKYLFEDLHYDFETFNQDNINKCLISVSSIDKFKFFLELGADINAEDSKLLSKICCGNNMHKEIKFLLDNGAKITRNIIMTCVHHDSSYVKILIDHDSSDEILKNIVDYYLSCIPVNGLKYAIEKNSNMADYIIDKIVKSNN